MAHYEICVAGAIGPVVASAFPGFTVTTLPPSTVVSGTAAGPDELLTVLNLIGNQGLALLDSADNTG